LIFFLVTEGYFIYNLATASNRPAWLWVSSIAFLALGAFVIGQWIREWRGQNGRRLEADDPS
jgi:hypothetical protein